MTSEAAESECFFRLFPDVIHLSGSSSKGALYLLAEKRLIKLGEFSNEIVCRVEKNLSVAQTAEQMGIPEDSVKKTLKYLEKIGAGCLMDNPCFVEKVRQPDITTEFMLYATPPIVNSFRISITSECSQNCIFCKPSDFGNRLKPCIGCQRGHKKDVHKLSIAQIQKAISEVALLDCRLLTLCVGDPDLVVDITIEAIDIAIDNSFSTIEYLSGSPLPETLLKRFVNGAVIPTFQIFSCREDSHDRVFGQKGGFQRLLANTEYFRKSHKPFNLYYLYTGEDNDPVGTINNIKELGPAMIYYDRIVSSTSKDNQFLFGENNISAPDIDIYVRSIGEKRCLNSVLTLNYDGLYHFCPALFDKEVGDVNTTTIQEIFVELDNDRDEAISMTEAIRCKHCEYKLGCHICKAPNVHSNVDISICGYKPQEGAWISSDLCRGQGKE